ncbi:MAG TPA: YciI family protein [Caulobacteraceae bacterium]|jgi:hypothetical protein|nr:YciI family protein [Caulobacteraceae bacterium]
MAYFLLICRDRPGSLALRMSVRAAHLDWVKDKMDLIRAAGPMLDDAGDMTGSTFLMQASDKAAVEAFSADDPYRKAGLFESVEICGWRQTVGAPL